jgi:hypothetical protein
MDNRTIQRMAKVLAVFLLLTLLLSIVLVVLQ